MARKQYHFLFMLSLAAMLLSGCDRVNSLLTASTIFGENPIAKSEIIDQGKTYFCDEEGQDPTLTARSDLGNVAVIVFETNLGEWTASKRCHEIAIRLTKLSKEKNLRYLTWERRPSVGRVINVAKHEGDLFKSSEYVDMLFVLKPEDKPHEIIDSLEGILSSFGDSPVKN